MRTQQYLSSRMHAVNIRITLVVFHRVSRCSRGSSTPNVTPATVLLPNGLGSGEWYGQPQFGELFACVACPRFNRFVDPYFDSRPSQPQTSGTARRPGNLSGGCRRSIHGFLRGVHRAGFLGSRGIRVDAPARGQFAWSCGVLLCTTPLAGSEQHLGGI